MLLAVGMLLLFSIYFLFQFPELLPGRVRYIATSALSLLLMGLLVLVCFEGLRVRLYQTITHDPEKLGRRCLLFLIFSLASLTHFNVLIHFPARIISLPLSTPNIVLWALLSLATVAMFAKVPRNDTPLYLLALLWGVLLRVLALHLVPFDPESADMLSAVEKACGSLLHGINPYGQTYFVNPTHSFPLVYFPLLWLPYLPFKALAVDIRWFNLIAQVTLFAFSWFVIGRNNRKFTPSLLLILLILLPDTIVSFFYRQMSHYWLLGAVYLWSVWRERWNAALLSVSGLLLMRITALTSVWLYLIYVWKRKGTRIAAMHAAVVAAVTMAGFLPFSSVGLARFKFLFFDSFRASMTTIGWQVPLSNLAIGGALEAVGLTRFILPLQVGGIFLIGALYFISRDRSFRTFAGLTIFADAYFIWVSGFVFVYYWFFPLVLLSTLYFIESRETPAVVRGNEQLHAAPHPDQVEHSIAARY